MTEPLTMTDPPSILVTCQSNCDDRARIDLSQNLELTVTGLSLH